VGENIKMDLKRNKERNFGLEFSVSERSPEAGLHKDGSELSVF
jgi:hypothetical protein